MEEYSIVNQTTEALISQSSPAKSPVSSQGRLMYLLSSPSRYLAQKFRAGGLQGSIFTIFASTVGAGILSLPYAINLSGLYQGIVLFILGMIVSLYTCQLYESIGRELYGKKCRLFVR